MRAKNSLNTLIDFVAVVDDAGKVWVGEKIKKGELKFLDLVERDDAVQRLRKYVTERSPQMPDALAGETQRSSVNQRRRWQAATGQFAYYSSYESMETNLPSVAIADLTGNSGKQPLVLPPRSYVAVTETGPEVEFGMDGVDEQASFHVIVGQW
jgi:hypothetical protein